MAKRFYEQDPALQQAVKSLFLFPEEIQDILFEGMNLLAEKQFKVDELAHQYRTLGTEKVLALFKSKQKKRTYDKNPRIHKAMNYLLVLSDQNRGFIAGQILEMVANMSDYLALCRDMKTTAERRDMETLTDAYVQHGQKGSRLLLQEFRKEFQRRIEKAPTGPQPPAPARPLGENIREGDNDMRIDFA